MTAVCWKFGKVLAAVPGKGASLTSLCWCGCLRGPPQSGSSPLTNPPLQPSMPLRSGEWLCRFRFPHRPDRWSPGTYSLLMPRVPRVTAEQREVLEELSRAATLRVEAQRYYLRKFWLALEAGVGTSVIGRYTGLSPQAANSAKNRLAVDGPDDDAPRTVRAVLKRSGYDISET